MFTHPIEPDPRLHLVRDDVPPRSRREPAPVPPAGEFVAVDTRTRALFARVDSLADCDSTVLITGETGTGKEVIARRLSRAGRRGRGSFVPVNCGALPDALAESELFGHRRGAFTGAHADKAGLVEEAEGGMLFLDEIGDMPQAVQVRMLRFLDSGETRRVGDTAFRHVRVRVVAATNRPLERDVQSGRFRADLFYRINVVALHVPPLRDRTADIPALASLFLARSSARLRKDVRAFSTDALARLLRYRWPGNIRQLQNAVECAVHAARGESVAPHELPAYVTREDDRHCDNQTLPYDADSAPIGGELEQIALALVRAGGNQRHAADALGISRTTLWRRLRKINGD
jgi:transcriptional regulator with PAS, ATPase and Fis domain